MGIQLQRVPPSRKLPSLHEDLYSGLLKPPRSIPSKYFYDAHGSELFERICTAPEYYPTRMESSLLLRYAEEIIAAVQPAQILELGSGSSRKIRYLLNACKAQQVECSYAPFDVCEHMLLEAGTALREEYQWLDIMPLIGDYHGGLENLPNVDERRFFVFLGGTVGNFFTHELDWLLEELQTCMRAGDYLLIGADRIKDERVLQAAYNDAGGVTAEFNLNVLKVLNREANANFQLDTFVHNAAYNGSLERMEMCLISQQEQQVHLGHIGENLQLDKGESILTEISRKFSQQGLNQLLEAGKLQVQQHYEADNGYFSLVLVQLPEASPSPPPDRVVNSSASSLL